MDLLYVILIGAVSGWLASMVVKGSGGGLIQDIVVGIVGSFIGGWVLQKLGIRVNLGSATVNLIITSVVGAVVLLFIVSLVRKK